MATSAPSLRQASHFSAEPAVTMTRAPNALASWIAAVPMPDDAAVHQQGLAGLEAAALEHVVPDREERLRDRGRLPAIDSPAGIGSAWLSCATQYSA